MLFENKGCVSSNSIVCVQCAHAQSCYQKVKNILCRGLNEKSVLKFFLRHKSIEIGSLLTMLSDSFMHNSCSILQVRAGDYFSSKLPF